MRKHRKLSNVAASLSRCNSERRLQRETNVYLLIFALINSLFFIRQVVVLFSQKRASCEILKGSHNGTTTVFTIRFFKE